MNVNQNKICILIKNYLKIIKINKCKCEFIFKRKVCTQCFKSELRQLNLMFMPYI